MNIQNMAIIIKASIITALAGIGLMIFLMLPIILIIICAIISIGIVYALIVEDMKMKKELQKWIADRPPID